MNTHPHICPECRDGKCRNCNGDAWCDTFDGPAECTHNHPREN